MIAKEVNSLDLSDELEAIERGRKGRKSGQNLNNISTEEIETQGDQLNRIKAQRRNIRSATTVTPPPVTVDDQRSHRRSTSQPKEDVYISPFKSLKPQTNSTTVSIYNTRSAIRRSKGPEAEEEDKPMIETISSVKYLRKMSSKSALPPNSKT